MSKANKIKILKAVGTIMNMEIIFFFFVYHRDPLDFLVLVARMENRDLADPQVQGGFPDQPVKMETT